MSTTTKTIDARLALNQCTTGNVAPLLNQMKFGDMSTVIKVTFASLTSAASFDITTATSKSKGTISGITLASGENLPAIGQIVSLRVVTGGTATAGVRFIGDDGATASATVAKLSDDGKTVTFEDVLTSFVLVYRPRSAISMTSSIATFAPGG